MHNAAEHLPRRQFWKCKELMTLRDQGPMGVDGAFRIGAGAGRVDDRRRIIGANLSAEQQKFILAAGRRAEPNELRQRHQSRVLVAKHVAGVDHDNLAQGRKPAEQRQNLVDMLLIFGD